MVARVSVTSKYWYNKLHSDVWYTRRVRTMGLLVPNNNIIPIELLYSQAIQRTGESIIQLDIYTNDTKIYKIPLSTKIYNMNRSCGIATTNNIYYQLRNSKIRKISNSNSECIQNLGRDIYYNDKLVYRVPYKVKKIIDTYVLTSNGDLYCIMAKTCP